MKQTCKFYPIVLIRQHKHRTSVVTSVTGQVKGESPRFRQTSVFWQFPQYWLTLHAALGLFFLLLRGNTEASGADKFWRGLLGVGAYHLQVRLTLELRGKAQRSPAVAEEAPHPSPASTRRLFWASPSYSGSKPASLNSAQSMLLVLSSEAP